MGVLAEAVVDDRFRPDCLGDEVLRPRSIEPAIVVDQLARHPWIGLAQAIGKAFVVGIGNVSPRQRGLLGPVGAHVREDVFEAVQAPLGKLAEGCDLATEDVQQRRSTRLKPVPDAQDHEPAPIRRVEPTPSIAESALIRSEFHNPALLHVVRPHRHNRARNLLPIRPDILHRRPAHRSRNSRKALNTRAVLN